MDAAGAAALAHGGQAALIAATGLVQQALAQRHPVLVADLIANPPIAVDARQREALAGADDYVCKPFDPAELRARVGARLLGLQDTLADRVGQLEAALAQVSRLQDILRAGRAGPEAASPA